MLTLSVGGECGVSRLRVGCHVERLFALAIPSVWVASPGNQNLDRIHHPRLDREMQSGEAIPATTKEQGVTPTAPTVVSNQKAVRRGGAWQRRRYRP
jgi:hypothetical protein